MGNIVMILCMMIMVLILITMIIVMLILVTLVIQMIIRIIVNGRHGQRRPGQWPVESEARGAKQLDCTIVVS